MKLASLEIVECFELGEVWVNVTEVEDISTVIRALPSTVQVLTVEAREVVTDEEGQVSEWLIFKVEEARHG